MPEIVAANITNGRDFQIAMVIRALILSILSHRDRRRDRCIISVIEAKQQTHRLQRVTERSFLTKPQLRSFSSANACRLAIIHCKSVNILVSPNIFMRCARSVSLNIICSALSSIRCFSLSSSFPSQVASRKSEQPIRNLKL